MTASRRRSVRAIWPAGARCLCTSCSAASRRAAAESLLSILLQRMVVSGAGETGADHRGQRLQRDAVCGDRNSGGVHRDARLDRGAARARTRATASGSGSDLESGNLESARSTARDAGSTACTGARMTTLTACLGAPRVRRRRLPHSRLPLCPPASAAGSSRACSERPWETGMHRTRRLPPLHHEPLRRLRHNRRPAPQAGEFTQMFQAGPVVEPIPVMPVAPPPPVAATACGGCPAATTCGARGRRVHTHVPGFAGGSPELPPCRPHLLRRRGRRVLRGCFRRLLAAPQSPVLPAAPQAPPAAPQTGEFYADVPGVSGGARRFFDSARAECRSRRGWRVHTDVQVAAAGNARAGSSRKSAGLRCRTPAASAAPGGKSG